MAAERRNQFGTADHTLLPGQGPVLDQPEHGRPPPKSRTRKSRLQGYLPRPQRPPVDFDSAAPTEAPVADTERNQSVVPEVDHDNC